MEELDKKVKVLQILFSGLGGHSNVAFSLIEADQDKKWQHEMLFYGVESVKPEYLVKCKLENIPTTYVSKKVGIDLVSYWKIFKQIIKSKPDVILLHSTNAIIPALMALIFGKFKIMKRFRNLLMRYQ